MTPPPETAAELEASLASVGYLADPRTSLALWLALRLERPLMIEGPAGVGKTELARAAAAALGRPLVRLQCYEGLDEPKALYEWDYAKQMLFTQLLRDAIAPTLAGARDVADAAARVATSEAAFFDERFLLERPLLRALRSDVPVVLLLDEIDRADPEFEAFLLEMLAEMQVTIPELGTVRARTKPLVVLTTNATREMTDALRRRCLHAALDYPSPARETAILVRHVPEAGDDLARDLADFVARVRKLEMRKTPSISEAIDWARALVALGARALDDPAAGASLGALLKHEDDRERVEPMLVGAKRDRAPASPL